MPFAVALAGRWHQGIAGCRPRRSARRAPAARASPRPLVAIDRTSGNAPARPRSRWPSRSTTMGAQQPRSRDRRPGGAAGRLGLAGTLAAAAQTPGASRYAFPTVVVGLPGSRPTGQSAPADAGPRDRARVDRPARSGTDPGRKSCVAGRTRAKRTPRPLPPIHAPAMADPLVPPPRSSLRLLDRRPPGARGLSRSAAGGGSTTPCPTRAPARGTASSRPMAPPAVMPKANWTPTSSRPAHGRRAHRDRACC